MVDIAADGCGPITNEIEILALTTYEVAPDGSGVRMNVIDVGGNPARVLVPIDCLCELARTMPKMVSDAVSGGRGDPTIRMVHSVESWSLERAADGVTALLTMETADRFQISFALPDRALFELADAVSAHEIEAFSPALRGH